MFLDRVGYGVGLEMGVWGSLTSRTTVNDCTLKGKSSRTGVPIKQYLAYGIPDRKQIASFDKINCDGSTVTFYVSPVVHGM